MQALVIVIESKWNYLQVVPLTANEAGTAFVVLFQLPLNPMPV
jgi:hypothetical protein